MIVSKRIISQLAVLYCITQSAYVFAVYPVNTVLPVPQNDLAVTFDAHTPVSAENRVALVSEVGGELLRKEQRASFGNSVRKGDVLFRIDPIAYQATLAARDAELQQAKLDLQIEIGKKDAAASELRFLTQAASQEMTTGINQQLILRLPHMVIAQAGVARAQKNYQLAQAQLRKTIVRAPCNGFLATVSVNRGDYISVGKPLAEVICDDSYQVIATVPIQYYRWLQAKHLKNTNAQLVRRFGNLQDSINAEIIRLVPIMAAQNRMLQVYVRIQSPRKQRYPVLLGEFVKIVFTVQTNTAALRLPIAALRSVDTLWIADAEQQLHIETVDLLHQDTQYIYVPYAFGATKRVITSQIANPKPGLALRVSTSQTP